MNDLESIILSLFDEGYTKSEIASQLDEILAKASSESDKARHDALLAEDAANVYTAMAKYYSDKYNDSIADHCSITDIIDLLDAIYSDIVIEYTTDNLDNVYNALKNYFAIEHNDPTFMDDKCSLDRLKQYLDCTYNICKRNEYSPIDATLERIQSNFYDYWYYTHDNTEIEITTEEIAYILESYYNCDQVETTPELLKNIAELLNVYFMRTRKGYHGKEIYHWFPTPDDLADYLDAINFPTNNPFRDLEESDTYESWDNYLAETQPNYTKGDIYREFPNEEDFAKFISEIYLRYFDHGDPNENLAQAIETYLVKTVKDYKPGSLTEIFPEPENVGDYVLTLYKAFKYFENVNLDFGDMLSLLFK